MTAESAGALVTVHDRMPLFLTAETAPLWLSSVDFPAVREPCFRAAKAHAEKHLRLRFVSDHVNRVGNDGPECLLEAAAAKEQKFAAGLGRFFSRAPKVREPKT